MKGSKKIVFILFLLVGLASKAQDTLKLMVSLVPQYVFNNGLRIDFEHQLKKVPSQWIGISPQIYYSEKGSFFQNFSEDDEFENNDYDIEDKFDTLKGFGLDLFHKFFLKKIDSNLGFYFQYGVSYHFFDLSYHNYIWKTQLIDGLEYIEYTPAYQSHFINKLGVNFTLGSQTELTDNIYLDIYAGLGMRYSLHSKEGADYKTFSNNSMGYGYSGALFVFGVRIGVFL
jgi:hypothetical protein